IGIDPGMVREGQVCFQTACRILATSCAVADWTSIAKSAKTISQYFPLVGDVRLGIELLERQCPELAKRPDYVELFQQSKPREGVRRLQGILKTVYSERD